MKFKKILWILPMILLISFIYISSIYANELKGQIIVEQIENMDVKYTYSDKYGMSLMKPEDFDKPITDETSLVFSNNEQIFNDIVIYIYKNEVREDDVIQASMSNQEIIHVGGRKMVVSKKKLENGNEYIYVAAWLNGKFYVSMTSTNLKMVDDTGNLRELEIMADMIDKALRNISGQQETVEIDTNKMISKDFEITLDVEDNPITMSDFIGLTADSRNSIKINLNLGNGFNGTYKIDDLKYGKLKKQKTSKELKGSGTVELEYIPYDYINGVDKTYTEKIRVTAHLESGAASSDEIDLQIHKTPIILVHGFTGDKTTWLDLDAYLQERGFDTVREEYYYNDTTGQSIPAQAHGLSRHIKDKIAEYNSSDIKIKKVDVVAHSMGGLISRHYISKQDDLYKDDIRKLVMVGTPNHGCNYLDKLFGWKISEDFNKHKKAAEQLYGKNPFIIDLNKGESEGKHLNPDVQYGIIYGTGAPIGGDGVVSDISVLLNGVTAVNFPGRTHSPAVSRWGTSLTLDNEVFEQILSWLETDIPLGEFNTYDMRVYSVEGEAYISNLDYTNESDHWRKLDDTSAEKIYTYDDIKTGDGRMVILLKAGSNIFGYVEMDKNTELYFEYVSPNIVRVNLSKGSAKFVSNSKDRKHFETVLKASDNIQIVRGLNTQYVVSMDDKPTVISLEGKIELINASSVESIKIKTIEDGQRAVFEDNGNFSPAEPDTDLWWENEFYKPISFKNKVLYNVFGSIVDYIKQIGIIDVILLIIIVGSGLYGYKRGFISTLFVFLSYFIAIIGAKLLAPKAVRFLVSNTTITLKMNNFINDKLASLGINIDLLNTELPKISQMITQDERIRQVMSQNPMLTKLLSEQSSIIANYQNIPAMLSHYILIALSMFLIFILLKIIISYIGKLFNNHIKLSLVAKANKILGLILGILTGFIISTIGVVILRPIALIFPNSVLVNIINNSLIVEKLLQIISI